MDDLREVIALALLNDDRKAGGWPEVKSREAIPNSEGYPRNADAALAAIKEAATEERVRAALKAIGREDEELYELDDLLAFFRAMIEAGNAPT